ncbi:MAG: cellulase family glycosylhydrolase [Candidatus Goldiibacteriota bacterium]
MAVKEEYKGFKVKESKIYDGTGGEFIIRGVNKMIVWLDPDGEPSFKEIEKTGANAVRIVWSIKDGTVRGLDIAIGNCIKRKMAPIIEIHDFTGVWDAGVFKSATAYWTSAEMLGVIKKYENYLIINYGNEIGNDRVSGAEFRKRYSSAVRKMRRSGIRVPVMIDAAAWGTGMDYIYKNWKYLVSKDPLKNLIFSIHMWWNDGDAGRVKEAIRKSAKLKIPLVVGEFAVAGIDNKGLICYETIITECNRASTGWLAWEWGPGNLHGNLMDMTKDGKFATLWGWAKEVCLDSPYSIKKTSVRPDIF